MVTFLATSGPLNAVAGEDLRTEHERSPEGDRANDGSAAAVRPVRVLLVGPSLDILGGQAVQLQRLLEKLRGLPGIEADFLPVNPRLPGPLSWLQRIKYLRTVVTSIAYVSALLRTVRRYDVVHAFSASYWSFVLAPLPAMVVARMLGKGVVLNYRSGEAEDHLTRWPIAVRAMRLAHEIVVPSGYLVEVFARFGLKARSVFNFVDVDRIPYRERRNLRPIFLSNRNLHPLYNVAGILRAFARIQKAIPEARLIVAGFGPERQKLEDLAQQLGLKNVEFRGKTDPSSMIALYDEADVYVNNPVIDNMPNSVIEAYAAGIPVVTSNAGGIPYIVAHERTGLMVARDDDEALAASALRLLGDPQLAHSLAERGRSECVTRYVWPAVAPLWQDLYRGVRDRATDR
jgi:glycosyltransferase involved in cell wall biosynthesis